MGDRHNMYGLLHQRLMKGNLFIQKSDEAFIEELRSYTADDCADAMALAVNAAKRLADTVSSKKSEVIEKLIYCGA